MTDGSPVGIRHRTIPERLAWLAARLREEKDWREPVALALDVLADELAAGEKATGGD